MRKTSKDFNNPHEKKWDLVLRFVTVIVIVMMVVIVIVLVMMILILTILNIMMPLCNVVANLGDGQGSA